MTTASASPKIEAHPPLARDAAGNLVAVPDGIDSLALSRETFGRPRKLRGPDKHLMRFPLHTSPDDVVELCGAGIYRVYALDAVGEQLGDEHIARWDLTSGREHRNAAMDPMIALRPERNVMPAAGSDLRFALEAMAQMMRTNTDALRLVAESQVDLAKTIATVKGLHRNAAMYLASAPPASNDDEADEEDVEDEDAEEARPSNYFDLLLPFSQALAPKVAELFPGLVVGMRAPAPIDANAVENSAESSSLASRPFEARELVDLEYARRKGHAKRAAAQSTSTPLKTRVMSDPALMQQIISLKKELTTDEVETLMSAASTWSDAAQTKFLDTIKPVTTEMAVAYCREVIETIRSHQATAEG